MSNRLPDMERFVAVGQIAGQPSGVFAFDNHVRIVTVGVMDDVCVDPDETACLDVGMGSDGREIGLQAVEQSFHVIRILPGVRREPLADVIAATGFDQIHAQTVQVSPADIVDQILFQPFVCIQIQDPRVPAVRQAVTALRAVTKKRYLYDHGGAFLSGQFHRTVTAA